ncbi:MAG TPA: DUF1223 domain-containing protein [Bryobacteraceae bacterium]|nr:DUF1223 domain-containing protein [Bryobacteraceae bacterium]
MKKFSLYLCFVPLLWAGSGDTRSPVIVELFTSEGCSSCPPADDLLARLQHNQNISNARVIALEEHVDYWNHLGWTDPFSSALYSARQNEYAAAFKVDSVYTPQMIINGRVEFVGNSGGRATSEIQRAALEPMATVRLHLLPNRKNNELTDLAVNISDLPPIRINGKKGGQQLDIYLAMTEDNLSSDVPRGENAGHRLRHASVVRSFGVIGQMDPGKQDSIGLQPTLKFPNEWKRENVKAVVFIQEHTSKRIIGAESLNIQ